MAAKTPSVTSAPRCGLCGDACTDQVAAYVLVVCDQPACADARKAAYHVHCASQHTAAAAAGTDKAAPAARRGKGVQHAHSLLHKGELTGA